MSKREDRLIAASIGILAGVFIAGLVVGFVVNEATHWVAGAVEWVAGEFGWQHGDGGIAPYTSCDIVEVTDDGTLLLCE